MLYLLLAAALFANDLVLQPMAMMKIVAVAAVVLIPIVVAVADKFV